MNWNLILNDHADGAWNMAVDEALLQCATETPVLRFYQWRPSCLSIGRFQSFDQILAASERLRASLETPDAEFGFVRRPTGGRAVWHALEITYSAVVREELLPPDAQSVAGAYRWLSEGFITGLAQLGVEAELAASPDKAGRDAAQQKANCFASATRCDFLARGRKLLGAAQCRQNGALLQHGSLLIEANEAEWRVAAGAGASLVSLRELGVLQTRDAIVAALCNGLERTHGAVFLQRELQKEETSVANGLHKNKYARDSWNIEGRAL
jgi:lipoate-protein ligase A